MRKHPLRHCPQRMRACLRCVAVTARDASCARRHLGPWRHVRRCCGGVQRGLPIVTTRGVMTSSEEAVKSKSKEAAADMMRPPTTPPSETNDTTPPHAKPKPTPMRGLTGTSHPSVNLPPLPLPKHKRKPGNTTSAFGVADGSLQVGRDFNIKKFDPVANCKFMDDRPWRCVDLFSQKIVTGTECLSSLSTGTIDLHKALACDGEGVDPSGKFLKRVRVEPVGKKKRFAYRFSLKYFGPGFNGWAWQSEDREWFTPRTVDGDLLPEEGVVGTKKNNKAQGLESNPAPVATGGASTVPDAEKSVSSKEIAQNTEPTVKIWKPGVFSVVAATQAALEALFVDDPGLTQETGLGKLVQQNSKTPPLYSAGRTDKGVHGAAQVVSFHCAHEWSDSEFEKLVKQRVAESPAGVLNHLKVANHPPPRRAHAKFHATFCATWRRYVYVFPLRQSFHEHRTPVAPIDVTLLNEILNELVTTSEIRETGDEHRNTDHEESLENTETAETATGGVDCYAFARDTIHGKNSLVTFMRARAFVSSVGTESTENVVTAGTENVPRCEDTGDKTDQGSLSNDSRCFLESTETNARHDDEKKEKETTTLEQVVVIELVANRFLRKLVRVLVSTAAREAATGAAPDVLLAIAATRERSATASPAPAKGLFFAGVGYGDHAEFDREIR